MKITKGKAFVFSLIAIIAVHGTSLFVSYGNEDPAPFTAAVLTAIVSLASMFIVGNVADNGVKGKFFNENLKDK